MLVGGMGVSVGGAIVLVGGSITAEVFVGEGRFSVVGLGVISGGNVAVGSVGRGVSPVAARVGVGGEHCKAAFWAFSCSTASAPKEYASSYCC